MPEKELLNHADSTALGAIALFVFGWIGKYLVSSEPFDPRRFTGELMLSCLSGYALYLIGVLQGLEPQVIFLVAVLSGMGVTRGLEWTIKILKAIKKV